MVSIREGQLEFTFTDALEVFKFDDPQTHQFSDMKAVDFIVSFPAYYLFVEVKDPDQVIDADPRSSQNLESFREKLESGTFEKSLKYKYRDSFLYQWASEKTDKPIKYIVLIEMRQLDSRAYQIWTDKMKRILPVNGPTRWTRQIVDDALVVNMRKWNQIGEFGSVSRRIA